MGLIVNIYKKNFLKRYDRDERKGFSWAQMHARELSKFGRRDDLAFHLLVQRV